MNTENIRLYELKKGDIISLRVPVPASINIGLKYLKTYYIYNRIWYKPWTWFKKIYFNQYEVL